MINVVVVVMLSLLLRFCEYFVLSSFGRIWSYVNLCRNYRSDFVCDSLCSSSSDLIH